MSKPRDRYAYTNIGTAGWFVRLQQEQIDDLACQPWLREDDEDPIWGDDDGREVDEDEDDDEGCGWP